MRITEAVGRNVCTGCGACNQSCPHRCIHLQEGEDGFLYPVVDETVCTGCGHCAAVCAVLHPVSTHPRPRMTMAAVVKERHLLMASTSGGVFALLARKVLEEGGVVCGAVWTDALEVVHECITSVDDLHRLQGSKYVQSRTDRAYARVRSFLKAGRTVLYCGTGCQVAGLRAFLDAPYPSLLTVELVCHGVPSPRLFREYLAYLQQRHGGKLITAFTFRGKHRIPYGEHGEFYYACKDGWNRAFSSEDPFYTAFLKGRTLRSCCHTCPYKGERRVADITLGDFKGIRMMHKGFEVPNGCSLCMVNSEHGMDEIRQVMEEMRTQQATYEEACRFNPSVSRPTPCPEDMTFSLDFKYEEQRLRTDWKLRLKNRTPDAVKNWLKKILMYDFHYHSSI